MTVSDLIRFLQNLPGNTKIGVVYKVCSELEILEEEDMNFVDKCELDKNEGSVVGPYGRKTRYVLRHGKLMEYDEKTWDKNEVPEFVPVLVLPGN